MKSTPSSISTLRSEGFSIIELMVVLAIIALLLTLVAPRYHGSISTSKEVVLKENLATIRKALDQHFADKGQFPAKLEDLVSAQYLRSLPVDPLTNSADTWILIGANSQPIQTKESSTTDTRTKVTPASAPTTSSTTIHDVRSGAPGENKQGGVYGSW